MPIAVLSATVFLAAAPIFLLRDPCITVTPDSALLDHETTIVVHNLIPKETISIKAETSDFRNIRWISSATFQSDQSGVVDVSLQAPLEGTYNGIDSMGLLWSMQAESGSSGSFVGKKDPVSIELKVFRKEQEIASKKIVRLCKDPDVQKISIREKGLVGVLFLPPSDQPLPVIVTLNGSSGGIGADRSQLLASHGFAVFALGYFGMNGLPPNLHDFPLEYFETAFNWIKSQHNLDGSRIGIYGISRGGELVLILGSVFPEFIRAIVADVPSSVITGGEGEESDLLSNAWSYQGKPLAPPASQAQVNFDEGLSLFQTFLDGSGEDSEHPATICRSFLEGMKDREAFAAAAIQVEKIRAALLIISGGDDMIWPSAIFSSQIEQRLRDHHSPIYCEHLHYPKAGHGINMPYLPQPSPVVYHPLYKVWISLGGTRADNWYACWDSWKKMISFFDRTLKF